MSQKFDDDGLQLLKWRKTRVVIFGKESSFLKKSLIIKSDENAIWMEIHENMKIDWWKNYLVKIHLKCIKSKQPWGGALMGIRPPSPRGLCGTLKDRLGAQPFFQKFGFNSPNLVLL